MPRRTYDPRNGRRRSRPSDQQLDFSQLLHDLRRMAERRNTPRTTYRQDRTA